VLVCGKPHTNTTMLRMIHGSQGRRLPRRRRGTETEIGCTDSSRMLFSFCETSLRLCVSVADAESSTRQILFGFQTFRNKVSAASETNAAATSTNHGP